jgi:hypothetical protein
MPRFYFAVAVRVTGFTQPHDVLDLNALTRVFVPFRLLTGLHDFMHSIPGTLRQHHRRHRRRLQHLGRGPTLRRGLGTGCRRTTSRVLIRDSIAPTRYARAMHVFCRAR